MNNNELVLRIIDEVDIKGIIHNCGYKSGIDDMLQYIYLVLLESDKLERVYEGGYIVPFIVRVVLNQRYGDHTLYNKYYRLVDSGDVVDVYDDGEYSGGSDVLMDYLNLEMGIYNNDVEYVYKKCLLIQLRTGKSVRCISREMGISNTILNINLNKMKGILWTKLMVLYIYIKKVEEGMKEHEFVIFWRNNVLGRSWRVDDLNEAYYLLEGSYPVDNCMSCVQNRLVYLQNKFGILIRVPSVMEEVERLEVERNKKKKRIKKNEVMGISEVDES